jgi:hypothetical protein
LELTYVRLKYVFCVVSNRYANARVCFRAKQSIALPSRGRHPSAVAHGAVIHG